MKTLFIGFREAALFIALTTSAMGTAQASDLILAKFSGSGFVPPEYVRTESCDFYTDKVIIKLNNGGVTTSESRSLQLSGDIKSMVALAQTEPETQKPNLLCDGPSTSTDLVLSNSGEVRRLPLFFTGGCGTNSILREGPASMALRNMIDKYCPTTFYPPEH